ncbi:MAG: DUF1697 domain-containing protein [Bryobacteraceae bacterium]
MSATFVALLRGINMGGKNKLPMKDLAAMFAEAGCAGVRTYIQSGNVVFEAAQGAAARLPGVIEKRIAQQFGYRIPVILRTAKELGDVVAGNPFLKTGAAPETLHVMFLADRPGSGAIEALDPHRSPPDEFIVQGREVYLRLPLGVARSKLTNNYFDAKLATVSTGRNWRTVTTLLELMGGDTRR